MIIRNVTVVDGTGGAPLSGVEVVVSEGRFTAIRPTTGEGPSIDGRGGYLVPGLWEGHTHLAGVHTRDIPESERVQHISRLLSDYLAAGITSVVDLGGSLDVALEIRDYRRTATDPAATLFFAGRLFTGVKGWPVLDDTERAAIAFQVDDPGLAHQQALALADQVDFIKCVYDGEPGAPDKLSFDALRAIVAAGHEKGKKVLVHVHRRRDVEEAVAAGADGIEHAFLPQDAGSTQEAVDIAALLVESNTYYCPTLVTWEQIGRNGDASYLDELAKDGILTAADIPRIAGSAWYGRPFRRHPAQESRVRLDYAMRTLGLMHEAGVKIAAGSDIAILMPSAPIALFRELQLLAKAGLPLPAVLAAGTRHVAEKIGQGAHAGTIRPGAVADALLLSADPRTDLAHLISPAHRVWTLRGGRML
ncbi:amidohydrolase family protein [Streptomyces sp. NPDC102264]|uniref:amidohydrolase family protein n=1 Tax=Streptomyces sp. NPDC102264 TaxID=3366149 RepID=UPI0038023799